MKDKNKSNESNTNQKKKMSTGKKVAIGMAAVAATLGAGYGAYKLSKIHNTKKAAGKKVLSDFTKMASESSLNNNLNKMDLDYLKVSGLSRNQKWDLSSKIHNRRMKNRINSKVMSEALDQAKGKIPRSQHKKASKIVNKMMIDNVNFEMAEELKKRLNF